MRINVYIDGFNLYYGSLKGRPYKWLDLEKMSDLLLPNFEVKRIRYFTARVKERADDTQAPVRQSAYLRALDTLPKVDVHLGSFLTKPTRMLLASPPLNGPRTVEVIKTEEKGSDVNLATYLLVDAFREDAASDSSSAGLRSQSQSVPACSAPTSSQRPSQTPQGTRSRNHPAGESRSPTEVGLRTQPPKQLGGYPQHNQRLDLGQT